MSIDEIASFILANLLLEIEALQSERCLRSAQSCWRNRAGLLLSRKVANAHHGIALYKPSEWLGRPLSGSERVKFCKALHTLENDGLVICIRDTRGRSTHLELTDSGKELAGSLLAAES